MCFLYSLLFRQEYKNVNLFTVIRGAGKPNTLKTPWVPPASYKISSRLPSGYEPAEFFMILLIGNDINYNEWDPKYYAYFRCLVRNVSSFFERLRCIEELKQNMIVFNNKASILIDNIVT